VASQRTHPPAVHPRRRPVRGGAAQGDRCRGSGRSLCSGARVRHRLLRWNRSGQRQERDDPDAGRILGHADSSRFDERSALGERRGGYAGGDDRPERTGRARHSVCPSWCPALRGSERVCRPAPVLAGAATRSAKSGASGRARARPRSESRAAPAGGRRAVANGQCAYGACYTRGGGAAGGGSPWRLQRSGGPGSRLARRSSGAIVSSPRFADGERKPEPALEWRRETAFRRHDPDEG
jgi:hypothetical protein